MTDTPRQLALPEPPDTATMGSAVKAKTLYWLGILNAEYYADRIDQREWDAAREEVWQWNGQELLRLDLMYRDFYGIR